MKTTGSGFTKLGDDSLLQLDLDLDASGEIQAHQRFHGLGAGIVDVDQALVGAALELLPVRLAVSTIFSALWSMS